MVSSQPPFQELAAIEGYTIRYPQYDFVPPNQSFTLHVHVYNTSNGVRINNDTSSCELHLYNPTGDHTTTSMLSFSTTDNEFELSIDGNNFSKIGTHAYIIQCNSTVEGGFASGSFHVTRSGGEFSISESILYSLFIFVLSGLFIFFLIVSIVIPFRDRYSDTGQIVSINDMKYFKVAAMVFSYLTLMGIFGIMRKVTFNYLSLNESYRIFQWMYWFMLSFTWPIIIVSLVLMLVMFLTGKRMKRNLERGGDVFR